MEILVALSQIDDGVSEYHDTKNSGPTLKIPESIYYLNYLI